MKRLGRYEILDELGHGAMGTVYRARDPKIDRVVALKTITVAGINPADEEEFRQRFFREAQAAGKLSHGGLVTIHDVGEDESSKTPFIVMEFIEGRTLEELGRGERLPAETTLKLVKQVAEALDYAHGQQIVHRDIKPANIIVTADGRAKITDFGIAKLQMTQFTQPGQVLGTPAYMSPEQLSGGAVDGRSDLFSLGVILYWLLTGDKPFAGDTTTAVSFKIVYQDPIPATQLNPTLSPQHDYLIGRALAKDLARRYQSGREFADDLEDLLGARPPRSQAAMGAIAGVEHTVMAQPRRPAPPLTATVKTQVGARAAVAPAAAIVAPEKKRRWLLPVGLAALLLMVFGSLGWWWAGGSRPENDSGEASAVEQAATATPPPSPTKTSSTPKQTSAGSTGSTQEPPPKQTTPPPPSTQTTASKPRQAPARTRTVPRATLRLKGKHNFARATLYLYADEKLLRRLNLRGKTKSRAGITVGTGKISTSASLTAGQHSISVRIRAPKDDFDQIQYIEGQFRAGQTRTLEISLGKLGKWVGIGELTRNLTLRWVD